MKSVASLAAAVGMSVALTGCTPPPGPAAVAAAAPPSRGTALPTDSRPPDAATAPAAAPTTGASPTRTAHSPPAATPPTFRTTVVHRGADLPDDLLLDDSGALLYSDYTNGTISRLDPGGTVAVLHRGIDGPEGMVLLPDRTLVVAEENTNRLLAYAPGRDRPTVIVTLPGRPTTLTCHQGVDGIAWDPRTLSLVVPDPVTGTVYRFAPDGSSRTVLARGFVHPVGAAVAADGRVFVADECGGNVWRLARGGAHLEVATASMPDDVALDSHGALLVTDVRHTRHDVRRWPLDGGPSTVLARSGLVEPQGLLVDHAGRIYVSDDQARLILRLTPASRR